jgi:hypothetical protein
MLGLEVVEAVELTTFHGSLELHILGYLIDCRSPNLVSKLNDIRVCDRSRAIAIVNLLRDSDVDVSDPECDRLAGSGVPKASVIVRTAMENGRNAGHPLFGRYRSVLPSGATVS